MNKKKILTAVMLLLIFGVLMIFYIKIYKRNKQIIDHNNGINIDKKKDGTDITEQKKYRNNTLGIAFNYPKDWNVEEVNNCHEFSLSEHSCIQIGKDNYEIRVLVSDNMDGIGPGKELIDEYRLQNSTIINSQEVTFLRSNYPGYGETKNGIIVGVPILDTTHSESYQRYEVNNKIYTFMYIIPYNVDSNTNLNTIDIINTMDQILESIEFI